MHDAATAAESSVHITLGIHPVRWADLLIETVRRAADSDVALRAAFPVRGERTESSLATELKRLLGRVADSKSCREVVHKRRVNLRRNANPLPDGHFRSLDRLRAIGIGLDTGLARRSGMSSTVAVENGKAVIRFSGNAISGPKEILPALRFVDAANAFMVRDLPDALSDSSKLVLAARLVREGLFSIS